VATASACCPSRALQLRYIVRLYVKELVLKNFVALAAEQVAERILNFRATSRAAKIPLATAIAGVFNLFCRPFRGHRRDLHCGLLFLLSKWALAADTHRHLWVGGDIF
jgi:hypothetical protein